MPGTTEEVQNPDAAPESAPTTGGWRLLLTHPRFPWLCMVLALLLGLPSIGLGLAADDWVQRLALSGDRPSASGVGPLLDFFTFIPGTLEGNAQLREVGALPWWSDPEMRGSFLRPVTVLSHMLDFQLWPDRFWMHHLHSLAWYCASVGLVVLFFRRFGLALPLAGLAGLMFAVEDAHGLAVGWIANRNASICMVFGVGCLWLHRRWRTEGRPGLGLASAGCLVLALLSAEAGIGALAYLVAWQWIMEEKHWSARLRGLVPYLLVVVAWRLAYQHLGYGAQWSDLYVDPGREPLRFLVAMAERLPLLMTAQWLQAPIDGTNLLELPGRIWMAVLAWAISLALLRWLWPLLQARREARFWALGMGLSLVPICASFPMDRVLTFTGLGAFALLAMQLEAWLEGQEPLCGFRQLLVFLHIPFAAVGLVARPFIWFGMMNAFFSVNDLPGNLSTDQTIVLLQTHDLAGAYMCLTPLAKGLVDRPIPVAMLGSVLSDTHVRRVDAHTLDLHTEGGWLRVPLERLTSTVDRPHTVGETIPMADYEVEILEITEDGRPLVARFVFERPLEDPRYRWFRFEGMKLTETRPPAVGEEQLLPSIIP